MGDAALRAGGHIERGDGKGWVVDDTPTPAPSPVKPHGKQPVGLTEAGGHRLTDDGWVLIEPGEPFEARPRKTTDVAEPKPVVKTPAKRGRPRKKA
jgi:hypothetical protein